ncbi:unnamed protein product [Echinostoma caproni]|uniref:EF-hand domain-containing protein n=1 Tax=Echinostoma caproni TaxID=27848 RepID=A0A183AJK7_9TREM|nr:unnamed protein product [Echinostoma caproni]
MEFLLETFFAIDKYCTKTIKKTDLIKYAEENGYEDSMPETWMTLFDPGNTGIITLESFCDKLGLSPESKRIKEWEQNAIQLRSVAPVAASAPVADKPPPDEIAPEPSAAMVSAASAVKDQLPPNIHVVFAQMPEPMKANIFQMARDLLQHESHDKPIDGEEVSKQLKNQLDEQYGRLWNVAIVAGSYWITHTHQDQRSFHFRMGDRTVIAWQNSPVRKVAQPS